MMFKFKDILKNLKPAIPIYLYILLFLILLLGYVVPVIMYKTPTGTDTYTHIFYTEEMGASNSVSAFYQRCSEKGYINCDYPFGLWLFGSIASVVTGIPVYDISYILPLILLFFVVGLYFAYAKLFLKNKEALIAVAFLLSMPIISINILAYSTLIFAIPLLLLILYFTFDEYIHPVPRTALVALVLFILSLTHTGTYIFLFFFSVMYIMLFAGIWGKLDYKMYYLTASMLVVYTISMSYFPGVQPQYMDKATEVITIGEWISSKTGIGLIGDLSHVFYSRVFVDKGLVDAILWSALIYMVSDLIVIIRSRVSIPKNLTRNMQIGVPVLGTIENVSHSVLTTPFWIGPIQTVLSLLGVFMVNDSAKCMFLSVLFVSVLPGSLHTGPTGALREIEYFLVILPITSAAGLTFVMDRTKFLLRGKLTAWAYYLGLFLIFLVLVITSFIGNAYYRPTIAGEKFEIDGMIWLSGVGSPENGVEGMGYRDMINVYSGKIVPSVTTVTSGSDTRLLTKYIYSIYGNSSGEFAADNLYAAFNVKYLLTSDRVLRNMEMNASDLTIDSNMKLDKVYSSMDNFAIYAYIEPSYTPISNLKSSANLGFDENYPDIKDVRTAYLIGGKSYKILISKTTPQIRYLGGFGLNLGEGTISDTLTIYWRGGPKNTQMNNYYLSDLNYSINAFGNEIEYSTILTGYNITDKWATLKVTYIFYQNSFSREITVYNDWVGSSDMEVGDYTTVFSPFNRFEYSTDEEEPVKKKVYPGEDKVKLDVKFNRLFINDETYGMYIKYLDTAPFPNTLDYIGSIFYNMSTITFGNKYMVPDSKYVHITQLMSVGNEEAAKKNADSYSSASIYPYPEGKPPIIIVSYLNSLNESIEPRLNVSLQAYSEYRNLGVNDFTEGVRMHDNDMNLTAMDWISIYNPKVILYDSVYWNGVYDNASVQEEKIGNDLYNARGYTSYYTLTPEDLKINQTYIDDILSLIDSYNKSRAKEFDCKSTIGIDRFPCFDLDSCWKACYTPVCQQVKTGSGKPFLDMIQELYNLSLNIDSNISAFTDKLNSTSEFNSLGQFDELDTLIGNIENNSMGINKDQLFDTNFMGFCYPVDYNLTYLEQARMKLADKRGRIYPLLVRGNVTNEKINISSDGIVLQWLRYNLDTIGILRRNNISFAIVDSIASPSDSFNEEGLRHPEFAYYMGDNTGVLLLPVSAPATTYLRMSGNFGEYTNSWKKTIDSVIKNDDMSIFLWESGEIGSAEYQDGIREVVEYAKNNSMKFSNAGDITKHYKLLGGVHIVVSNGMDTVNLRVSNNNSESIGGLAFKVILPRIAGTCPYSAKGASIVRTVEDSSCNVYVSLNLDANYERNVTIEPIMGKNSFKLELADPITEGDVRIHVRDNSNESVGEAVLSVGGVTTKTDENGTAAVYLRRGNYTMTLEKPGFVDLREEIEVKGRVYLLEKVPVYVYVIAIFVLAVVYYEARKRLQEAK